MSVLDMETNYGRTGVYLMHFVHQELWTVCWYFLSSPWVASINLDLRHPISFVNCVSYYLKNSPNWLYLACGNNIVFKS